MKFTKKQRVKLNIPGMTDPGTVTDVAPTADGKGQWVSIDFDSGAVGCYHSSNVEKAERN